MGAEARQLLLLLVGELVEQALAVGPRRRAIAVGEVAPGRARAVILDPVSPRDADVAAAYLTERLPAMYAVELTLPRSPEVIRVARGGRWLTRACGDVELDHAIADVALDAFHVDRDGRWHPEDDVGASSDREGRIHVDCFRCGARYEVGVGLHFEASFSELVGGDGSCSPRHEPGCVDAPELYPYGVVIRVKERNR